jgi:hypothetical protein
MPAAGVHFAFSFRVVKTIARQMLPPVVLIIFLTIMLQFLSEKGIIRHFILPAPGDIIASLIRDTPAMSGLILHTFENTIRETPDLIRRFLKASAKGSDIFRNIWPNGIGVPLSITGLGRPTQARRISANLSLFE